jgi:hypothetical protein
MDTAWAFKVIFHQQLGQYSGRNITPSLDDRYKYTRGWEGKTAKR